MLVLNALMLLACSIARAIELIVNAKDLPPMDNHRAMFSNKQTSMRWN